MSSLPSPQRAHVLDVPFAMRGVAAASKARWDKEHGVFIYDGAELPPALAPFRAQPYSWEMHVQRELASAPPRKPSPPHASITLRAHQQEAARAIGAARAAAAAAITAEEITDATYALNGSVVRAWLFATNQRFDVDPRDLATLARADLPLSVLQTLAAIAGYDGAPLYSARRDDGNVYMNSSSVNVAPQL
ncbi:MAG: hypothetical protein ACRENC_04950, partial [Gemmatimonadaceae bacterium]